MTVTRELACELPAVGGAWRLPCELPRAEGDGVTWHAQGSLRGRARGATERALMENGWGALGSRIGGTREEGMAVAMGAKAHVI